MGAASTWGKVLSINTSNLMRLDVCGIVDYSINSRTRNLISRFENIAYVCHYIPPAKTFCCLRVYLSKA
jgi:hypothetical protein